MNELYLTTIFASLLTFIYLFLSFRVGYFRGSPVMRLIFKMDDEINEKKLNRNVRSHGNFSEYVPIFLILLLILEIKNETPFLYLLITCFIFLYGRLAHAICFSFFEFNPFLRISGMLCTYLGLGILSLLLVYQLS
tara:strand:- start:322 stop:729 length:408 start_codon:yes stop_codon:yes gene_type:complete